jgi:[acyl-carrier-protein] S-malonyltransferase
VLAGHSLGEIAALVAAGALDWRDGVRLVAARGRLMSEAAQRNPGAMVVLKAEIERVEELAERVEVTVANHNAPDQVVVAGPEARIARLEAEAADAGIACRRLRIKGAFHTPALAEAAERFAEVLAGVDFEPTSSVVYSCVTARPFTDPGRELAAALISRVRWLETLRAIRDSGIASFVDVGPGRVMAGLVRRCLDDVEVDTNPGLRAEAAR